MMGGRGEEKSWRPELKEGGLRRGYNRERRGIKVASAGGGEKQNTKKQA